MKFSTKTKKKRKAVPQGGRADDERHWLSEKNNDAEREKRNRETESGELRELRRDGEKNEELSRDRRPDSHCWDLQRWER